MAIKFFASVSNIRKQIFAEELWADSYANKFSEPVLTIFMGSRERIGLRSFSWLETANLIFTA